MSSKAAVTLADDDRKHAIASIKRFVREELDEEIGDLKASLVLDYFLQELGPAVYNKAIADATTFFTERTADLGALAFQEEFQYWPGTVRRRP